MQSELAVRYRRGAGEEGLMKGWQKYALAVSAAALATLLFGISVFWLAGQGEREAADLGAVDVGWDDSARMVTIEGVPCIVVNGRRSVAVSCDWSGAR